MEMPLRILCTIPLFGALPPKDGQKCIAFLSGDHFIRPPAAVEIQFIKLGKPRPGLGCPAGFSFIVDNQHRGLQALDQVVCSSKRLLLENMHRIASSPSAGCHVERLLFSIGIVRMAIFSIQHTEIIFKKNPDLWIKAQIKRRSIHYRCIRLSHPARQVFVQINAGHCQAGDRMGLRGSAVTKTDVEAGLDVKQPFQIEFSPEASIYPDLSFWEMGNSTGTGVGCGTVVGSAVAGAAGDPAGA
jgi:hypothetical protein